MLTHYSPMRVSALLAFLARVALSEYARVSPDGAQHWSVVFGKFRAMWAKPSRGISERELASIKAPTLIIAGDKENVERHVRIFRGIAGAELCFLPATGHATFPDRADWLNLQIAHNTSFVLPQYELLTRCLPRMRLPIGERSYEHRLISLPL